MKLASAVATGRRRKPTAAEPQVGAPSPRRLPANVGRIHTSAAPQWHLLDKLDRHGVHAGQTWHAASDHLRLSAGDGQAKPRNTAVSVRHVRRRLAGVPRPALVLRNPARNLCNQPTTPGHARTQLLLPPAPRCCYRRARLCLLQPEREAMGPPHRANRGGHIQRHDNHAAESASRVW
jgi:hypothetical protein